MNRMAFRQHGVSLIEAVVAMAVMGFGMLGVLGLQSSLRGNADISKQRSEAVRIAQETVETRRAFSVLAAAPGAASYDQIASAPATNVIRANANATFSLQTTVTTLPINANVLLAAPHKRLVVDVTWRDRNDDLQLVRLGTMVSPVAPEVTAALSTPSGNSPAQEVAGRSPAIPTAAVDLGNGTSRFAPPGAATGVSWTFNNINGDITQRCVASTCTDFLARLLAGYVNFETGSSEPSSLQAETPSGVALVGGGGNNVEVRVEVSEPSSATINCFEQPFTTFVAYYCAVPVTLSSPFWTGRATLILPGSFGVANDIGDNRSDRYRVCRYTKASARVLPHVTVPTIRNEDHPLDYYRVANTLVGQNYLVIRAGNGIGSAFNCPADSTNPITPDIDGTTWHHQPDS